MPMSRQVRLTRTAISPRLAMRMRFIGFGIAFERSRPSASFTVFDFEIRHLSAGFGDEDRLRSSDRVRISLVAMLPVSQPVFAEEAASGHAGDGRPSSL